MDERDLREQFARLRAVERQRVPAFARATAPRVAHRTPASLGLAVAIVATLVLSVFLLPRDEPHAGLIDLRASHWTGPTDFLLSVPGDWMLREVPSIGAPMSVYTDSVSHRRSSS